MLNKKIIFFCILAYLFQFIIENLAISSSSFFIDVIGAEQLPKALIISSLLTPIVIFVLSLLEGFKKSRQYKVLFLILFSISFLFFMFYNTGVPNFYSKTVWMYQIFGSLFSLISIILYWNLINAYFYVFESKLFFSYFIISEEIGAISSDVLINKIFYGFSIAQYFLVNIVLLIILLFFYFYVFKIKVINEEIVDDSHKESKSEEKNNSFLKNKSLFNLAFLYIVVICLFHFITTLITYQFNFAAGATYGNTEDLNKFFSEFQFFSSLLIIATSYSLNKFLFTKSKIIFQHLLYGVCLLFLVYFMNISYTFYVIAAVEMAKVILEHSLFQTSYEHFTASFNEKVSDKLRNYTEGFYVPAIIVISGLFMNFFPSKFSFYYLNFSMLFCILFVIFLAFLIKNYYYKYHLDNVKSNIGNIRSIQALGEKNNIPALKVLMENFEKTQDRFLKKNMVISMGKINSDKTIDYIFNVLNNSDEFMQSAAVEALFNYKSFKVEYLLVEFVLGEKNKSLYIRHKVISFINKVYKNAIVPFFMHLLYSDDHRVVANTIENFWEINDKKLIPYMIKFLNHPSNRVRANVIILIYNYKISYYNSTCIVSLMSLKKSSILNDNLSFVFVVGFLKIEKYSQDVEKIYERLKNTEFFKERLVENFAFSFSGLKNPIGDDLFQFLFLESVNYPQSLLYKFKLLSLSQRINILKTFMEAGFGDIVQQNLYNNFKNSIYDLSFEVEMIEELMNKKIEK
ncbi:hypothetical protein GCL60_04250 [Silvanigrella paludirubra]|uniref:HEAT repeat domain-containing protein n=1 Tax=Silvanigrella paludirubra TaxID=2499159 RepID=A0A6N6VTH1_9BACT|nr:HEAT repeat domain-containing protein [Silvanigrella paludirubra]KAB8039473.1 hypothetical protein GCL60_04250 [Silvanigrella paludirubra]